MGTCLWLAGNLPMKDIFYSFILIFLSCICLNLSVFHLFFAFPEGETNETTIETRPTTGKINTKPICNNN